MSQKDYIHQIHQKERRVEYWEQNHELPPMNPWFWGSAEQVEI